MGDIKQFWVGVLKGKYKGHDVVDVKGAPEPEDYPQYAYMIGPFNNKKLAEEKARTEKNGTGMFYAYPGHPR